MEGSERTGLTVGVLTPHAAAGPEAELPEMAGGRVTAVMGRVRSAGTATETIGPPTDAAGLLSLTGDALDEASATLREKTVDVVVHASTTTSYTLGRAGEDQLVERLRRQCGAPVVMSGSSAVEALRACGAQRVALVHPPWFDDELDVLGVAYLRDQGFEVSLSKATGIPDDPRLVRAQHVVEWVARHLDETADAVFIGGNGFRAAGAIEELERATGRLVLEANQVLLWSLLRVTRTAWEIAGYGRLFHVTAWPSSCANSWT